jgi:hypothetical protein
MLELVFEFFLYTVSQSTGYALVYALTLGQVRCNDTIASFVGATFWIALLLLSVRVLL